MIAAGAELPNGRARQKPDGSAEMSLGAAAMSGCATGARTALYFNAYWTQRVPPRPYEGAV